MAISYPKIALGIPIPNPTFSLADNGSSAGSQGAAGWDRQDANVSMTAIDGSEDYGHPRAQRYSMANGLTKRVYGQFSPYGLCTANASTQFMYAVVYKGTGTGSWRLEHVMYDSAGAALLTTAIGAGAISSTQTDWTLREETATITVPANTKYHGINLILVATSSFVRDFRFVGVGTWWSASSYTLTAYPDHPGTYARLLGRRNQDEDSLGRRRYNMPHRGAHAYELAWNFTAVDDTMNELLTRVFQMNLGTAYQGTPTANPGSGQYPLLIVPNYSGMPLALYADIASETYPLTPTMDIYWDPPYWGGTMPMLERL